MKKPVKKLTLSRETLSKISGGDPPLGAGLYSDDPSCPRTCTCNGTTAAYQGCFREF